jgi:hypothetical protein
MSRHDRYLFGLALARWGFAALVAAAIAVGLFVATTITPPAELPTVALRAAAVYRVEVGGAVFLGLYIATMALSLALHNRGFTEFGSGAIRARDLAAVSADAISAEASRELLDDVMQEVRELSDWREEIENAG